MPLRIATWNVNSVRQRLEHLERFCGLYQPDVICLQEIKVASAAFPADDIEAIGYPHRVVHGQKGYNGVAQLSRRPLTAPRKQIWCDRDDCRHAAATVGGVELHNFYVPSGGDLPDPEKNDKFAHKLQFLTEMAAWAKQDKLAERKAVIVGDLNVAPLEHDVWNHKRLQRSVGHTPREAEHMARLWAAAELIDVPRHFVPEPEPLYTWWGYRFAQSYAKDYGWRLDHVLVTPPLRKHLKSLEIVRQTRTWERPSDHVPVVLDLE
ncbi:MAG: exodeoxyribonuclease III [Kiloniellaceae bacterium]